MSIGIIFIIIGVVFLLARIALYKVGSNPFDESPDKDTKNLPQLVMLLLLAEAFMLFGVFLVDSPFPTTTQITSHVYTGNTLSQTINSSLTTSTSPQEPSYQPIIPWLVAYIFTFVVVLLIFVDGIKMFRTSANHGFKLR